MRRAWDFSSDLIFCICSSYINLLYEHLLPQHAREECNSQPDWGRAKLGKNFIARIKEDVNYFPLKTPCQQLIP